MNTLLATLSDPEFKEAMEVINGYTAEQKRRHAYDMRENYQRILASFKATGFDEGLAEGEARGEVKRNLEVARAMKAEGLSLDQIQRITGLSPSDIEKL